MSLLLDGVPLTDAARRWWVEDDTRLRQPPAVTISDVTIPGMHGVIPSLSSTFNPGGCTVAMGLKATSYGALLVNLAALTRLFGPRGRLRTLTDTDGGCRAQVQYVSASELALTGFTSGTVDFTLSLPRSFWEDIDPVTVDLGGTDGVKAPAQLQGGSAPIVDPIFVAGGNGAGTDITITDDDSGSWLRFDGAVPAGQAVRIRPDRGTAHLVDADSPWSGGTAASGLLELGPGQFRLTEDISFTVDAAGGAGLQLRARRAYQ